MSKIMNLLDNTPNQLPKLRTHNLFEMNNGSRRTYNTISQIKLKTSMPKINLCDYSDAYILGKGTKNGVGSEADDVAIALDRNNEQAIFKYCPPFMHCMTEVNNTKIFHVKDVM